SEAEHVALPPRWSLIHSADGALRGWVAARYLAEDGSTPLPAETSAKGEPDDILAAAEMLVRDLYAAHAMAMPGAGQSPLQPPRALDIFSDNIIATLTGGPLGADPIYDAQDADIANLRIALDPDEPMFRGMITVRA